jgi:hypothetical protein
MRNLATLAGVAVLCAALGCTGGPAETEDEDEARPAGWRAEAASRPMFHGRQDMAGVAPGRLPRALTLRW